MHAVLCAADAVQEPFCVINADDYYGVDAYRTIYEELGRLKPEGEATIDVYKRQFGGRVGGRGPELF